MKNWSDLVPWQWVSSSEIAPGVVAIDVPNYLTRRLSVVRTKYPDGRIPLHHVGVVLGISRACLQAHILPVLVFDGPPERRKRTPNPDIVRNAADLYARFSMNRDPFDEVISEELLKSPALQMYFAVEHIRDLGAAIGLPTHTAPSEAEMFAAVMCREGLVDSVISNDSDALLFGSPHVAKQLQFSKSQISRARLRDLEFNVGLDLENLRNLAVLCGCDFYPEGVKGIGPRRGILLLQRYGTLEGVLRSLGYNSQDREKIAAARESFDEVNYVSVQGLTLKLNPPIIPRMVRMLSVLMSEEKAESATGRFVRLWREFGNQQSTLEQWL
ncbi:MAG: hypothetical protein ACFE7R_08830 [Candidatus Hodarchaeota archaeon]